MEGKIEKILEDYRKGNVPLSVAKDKMRLFLFESLGYATIDHHRNLRHGFPEVVFGMGKDVSQIEEIVRRIEKQSGRALVTKVSREKGDLLLEKFKNARYSSRSSIFTVGKATPVDPASLPVAILSAGTSDIAVAEEASLTAEFLGNRVRRVYDVGVSGIHRLLLNREAVDEAGVIIVVAGMEGALPSVVGGLSGKPVVAVPTSVGYGSAFGGISALLGMLNSCAPGVVVVNIDNGFGAAYFATLVNKSKERACETEEKS